MSDIKTLKNSRQYRIIQVCGVALTLRSKNKPLLNANLCFCKANDIDKILALQDKAHSAMKQKEWFAHIPLAPSLKQRLGADILRSRSYAAKK